jgi:hypothetical protein
MHPLSAFPERKKRQRVISVYTPESDFMESVKVIEHSPRHIKMMRDAAQMEPDGPEADELKRMGLSGN